jgi:hypothetical protein
MRYFKHYWDEPRGDEHNAWGRSSWYFETNEAGVVSRQIEVYEHGPILRYDQNKVDDEFGKLSEALLDIGEFSSFEIQREDFEQAWAAE